MHTVIGLDIQFLKKLLQLAIKLEAKSETYYFMSNEGDNMKKMKNTILLCLGLLTSISCLAIPQECNALMEKVEKRLESKGIKNYTLEWIDATAQTSMRIIGRCSKLNLKLAYSQHHNKNKKSDTKMIEVEEKPTQIPISPQLILTPTVTLPVEDEKENVQKLIQSLYSNNSNYANQIQEIINRPDTTQPLIKAYYTAVNDATFRFNVILLLNQKIKTDSLGPLEMDAAVQCLLDGLKDSSPLVRGEALWGLGQTRNKKWAPAVNTLLNDPDAAVRSEAQITSNLLR
jgi:hypothetical protein